MANSRTQATLGDLCEFLAGSAFPKSAQGEPAGDYPFIKVSDMNLVGNERHITEANNWVTEPVRTKLKARLHPTGSVAFAKIGIALTYNRRRILDRPTILDNNMMSAVPRDGAVDKLFFYYLLRTVDFNIIAAGTALPYLNVSDLKKIPVEVPQLPVQQRIADVLGKLDDKIELNRRMNRTLEKMAAAIFKSLFIDFDPVHAKAEGRDPNLPAEIADLFPDTFQDSDLGPIPKGWRVAALTEGFNLTMGQSPPGNTYNEHGEGVPFYQGRRDFGVRYPTPRVSCTAPTRFAELGDTLLTVRAPVGEINMAADRCSIGRGNAILRRKSGSRSFTFYAMKALRETFATFEGNGTVFGCLTRNDLSVLPLLHPSSELVEQFKQVAYPLDQKIETLERQSRTLAALRDTLLPKLLTGEIELPEAEAIAEEVV